MVTTQKESLDLLKHLYSYLDIDICCEECSTNEHPIFMTQIDGIWFKCPVCKKSICVIANIKSNVGTHWGSQCKECKELEEKYNVISGREK